MAYLSYGIYSIKHFCDAFNLTDLVKLLIMFITKYSYAGKGGRYYAGEGGRYEGMHPHIIIM